MLATIFQKKPQTTPQSTESCELSCFATLCSSLGLSSTFNSQL